MDLREDVHATLGLGLSDKDRQNYVVYNKFEFSEADSHRCK